MLDPTYPAFPVLAILGGCLVIVPLPWHLQAWNSGTCLYMIWTSMACLNLGINSIVWRDTAIDHAPVWCDISSRIIVAAAVAIPAASLCINRRLYCIASIKNVSVTRTDKRKAIITDLAIGIGIPVLQILFQYIVSGHRFDVFEQIGCYPYTYNTPLAYPFSMLWPIMIGIASALYCIMSLRAFLERRVEFNQYLASNTSLTANRYFRLMALASVELLCTIPISAYGIYLNVTAAPMNPWISWENVHWHYAQVDLYPAVVWRSDRNSVLAFELSRWAAPFCAFVFFAFFGFADEARKHYSLALVYILKHIHLWPVSTGDPSASPIKDRYRAHTITSSLPSFVARPSPPSLPSSHALSSIGHDLEKNGECPEYHETKAESYE